MWLEIWPDGLLVESPISGCEDGEEAVTNLVYNSTILHVKYSGKPKVYLGMYINSIQHYLVARFLKSLLITTHPSHLHRIEPLFFPRDAAKIALPSVIYIRDCRFKHVFSLDGLEKRLIHSQCTSWATLKMKELGIITNEANLLSGLLLHRRDLLPFYRNAVPL